MMGRLTWLSIPEKLRPLKNRYNIVVTSRPEAVSGAHCTAESLSEALSLVSTPPLAEEIHEVFIFGGARLFEESLTSPQLDRVFYTDIRRDFEGDVLFPKWEKENFSIIRDDDVPEGVISENGVDYQILVYKKCSHSININSH